MHTILRTARCRHLPEPLPSHFPKIFTSFRRSAGAREMTLTLLADLSEKLPSSVLEARCSCTCRAQSRTAFGRHAG